MATVLMPIPSTDLDPTETSVPWRILEAVGHDVIIATPDGRPGAAHRFGTEFAAQVSAARARHMDLATKH